MSPTILRLLLAYERQTRRWQGESSGHFLRQGMPASARYYSARCCWPDALTQARDTLIWIERA